MKPALTFTAVADILQAYGIQSPELDAIATSIMILAGVAAPAVATADRNIASIARFFHKGSLRRQELVGHGADDLGWNMLLTIFADQIDGIPISVTSACHASGGATTTALRHLDALHGRGLLTRCPDGQDRRRANLTLTPRAVDEVRSLILGFCTSAVDGRLTVPLRTDRGQREGPDCRYDR